MKRLMNLVCFGACVVSATAFAAGEVNAKEGQNANIDISINSNCRSADASKKLIFDSAGTEILLKSVGSIHDTGEKTLGVMIVPSKGSKNAPVEKIMILKTEGSLDGGKKAYSFSKFGVTFNVTSIRMAGVKGFEETLEIKTEVQESAQTTTKSEATFVCE